MKAYKLAFKLLLNPFHEVLIQRTNYSYETMKEPIYDYRYYLWAPPMILLPWGGTYKEKTVEERVKNFSTQSDIVSRINAILNKYWESEGKVGVVLDVPMNIGDLIYNDIFIGKNIE